MGPIGFARPSFWLAVEKDDWTAANRLLARHDLQLRLTLDDALGGHDAVAWYRLAQETKEAMELAGSRKPLSEADEKTP